MEENIVSLDTFKKLDLRVGRVTLAERVAGSDKLLRLEVELDNSGTESGQTRQIVAGIGKVYDPALLVGREIIIIANLEPRKLMGLESQGMLLAASDEGGPALLMPDRTVTPGSKIS